MNVRMGRGLLHSPWNVLGQQEGRGGLVYNFEIKFDPLEYADKGSKFRELKGRGG